MIAGCGLGVGLGFSRGSLLLCRRHRGFTDVVLVSGNSLRREGEVQLNESESVGTGDCT